MYVMRSVGTGIVSADTRFVFHEHGGMVEAEYHGGAIRAGRLLGLRHGEVLKFWFVQIDNSSRLAAGEGTARIEISTDSRVRLTEEFTWADREGGGRNVLEEVVLTADARV